jgi:hypothetical protein
MTENVAQRNLWSYVEERTSIQNMVERTQNLIKTEKTMLSGPQEEPHDVVRSTSTVYTL